MRLSRIVDVKVHPCDTHTRLRFPLNRNFYIITRTPRPSPSCAPETPSERNCGIARPLRRYLLSQAFGITAIVRCVHALRRRNRQWNAKTTYSIFDHVARYDVRISLYEVLAANEDAQQNVSRYSRISERRYKHYGLNIRTISDGSAKLKSDKRRASNNSDNCDVVRVYNLIRGKNVQINE